MEPRSNASSLDVDWETEFFYAQTRAEEMSHDLVYKFSIMEGVAGLYGNTVIYFQNSTLNHEPSPSVTGKQKTSSLN